MKINLVERANPQNRSEKKWYANAVNAGTKTMKTISEDIAGRSSLTKGDIENVLSNFVDLLPALLKDGFSVQLGDFGTIRLSLSSKGAENPETFDTKTIEPKVVFTPSVIMKNEIKTIKYEHTK